MTLRRKPKGELAVFDVVLSFRITDNRYSHFFGCRNLGASKTEIQGTISLVQEVARQLDLGRIPGSGDQFRFLNKAESW